MRIPPASATARRRSGSWIRLLPFFAVFPASAIPPDIPFAEEIFPGLEALLEEAGTHAPELRLGSLRVEERTGELEVARGQRLPRATFNARLLGAYEIREDIDDTLRGSANASFILSQPLYTWGALDRRETIAEHRVTLEELEAERSGASQFMQLRQAYLQWLLMQERLAVLEQSVELSTTFLEARRRLLEAGLSSEQEVLEMEARVMENQESIAFIEKTMADLENRFRNLSGVSFMPEDPQGVSLEQIQPMDEATWEALEERVQAAGWDQGEPQTERWKLLETIEEEQLAILDKRNWPTLDFITGFFSDQLESVNSDEYVARLQYYAGLQVNWNLFDGWQTDGYRRSALARKRSYAILREHTGGEVRRQAEALLAELDLNRKQVEARSRREALLERRVRLLREQVDQNRVSGVDLIEGEIDYFDVRQRLMEARVQYLMNTMRLCTLLWEDPALARFRSAP